MRQFESREASIFCGFEGKYTLNRTARNRMKQALRAIKRCGWTQCRWNDRHFYCLNKVGQKREICLYYNSATSKPMISFRLDEGLWAAPECHITACNWSTPSRRAQRRKIAKKDELLAETVPTCCSSQEEHVLKRRERKENK